jgi:hypothetical protein
MRRTLTGGMCDGEFVGIGIVKIKNGRGSWHNSPEVLGNKVCSVRYI